MYNEYFYRFNQENISLQAEYHILQYSSNMKYMNYPSITTQTENDL